MFRNLTVRSKLLSIVAAVTILFGITAWTLGHLAKKQLVHSMQNELERSTEVTAEFVESRFRQLNAGLNSLVDSPEIRAVLTSEGIDHETQLMSLIDLQHVLGADSVLYCDANGKTLARTDDPFDTDSIVSGIPMIKDALTGTAAKGFWKQDETFLLALAFPVTLDDNVEGVVMAGLDIQDDAGQLRSLLLRDVVLRFEGQTLSSSLSPEADVDADSDVEPITLDLAGISTVHADDLTSADDVKTLPRRVIESGHNQAEVIAAAVSVLPEQHSGLEAIVLVPVESVFGFFNEFQRVLLVMGCITIGLSIGVTFYIGAIISGQVRMTLGVLETVADGDLSVRLEIDSTDEFGRIASALNTAIQTSGDTLSTLAVRNRDTKTLLDAVEQGFFTVNSSGVMSEERSGAVDRQFGTPEPGMTLSDFIAQFDPGVASWIDMGLDDVFAEIMPVEVTIDQLPKRFVVGKKIYSILFTPVYVEDKLRSLAVVLNDITAQVENEKLEAVQREMLAMVQRIADDKSGFLEFFQEGDDIIQALRNEPRDEFAVVARRVHTLKGNTSIFGLEYIAEICHSMEDYIAENGSLPGKKSWTTLFAAWDAARDNMRKIIGEDSHGVEVSQEEYTGMFHDIVSSRSRGELAVRMASWQLEPTSCRLNRIAEQATALGHRLGKGDVSVVTRGGNLRTEPGRWSEFWSSFVHVVRNAIDHGLESQEERVAVGKSEAGRIEIETAIKDEQFIIAVTDDGRGINWDRVAEAATKKGLPTATQQDLENALFADGLTTAQSVSETSGRGVGMAAIKASCESLDGRIVIDSKKGKGTSLRFEFPIDAMAPETSEMLVLNEVNEIRALLVDETIHDPAITTTAI